MSVDSHIKDAEGKRLANVVTKEGLNCLSVVSQDYKEYLNKSQYFVSDIYGIDMNQDFSNIESVEYVHDGNDNTYWTATITTGNPNDFDFSSTDYAHTGTQSINCTPAEEGDEFQLENNPNTLISSSAYDRFSGWVYVTGNWNGGGDGLEIYFYDTINGTMVSDIVDLSNYISQQILDTWQKFNIPLSDFGSVSDYNAMRFRVIAEDGAPDFYLDDLELVELAGEAGQFIIEPPRGAWWHINGLGILIAAPYDSTLSGATMPKIPYNGFLGVSLANGMLYQRQEENEIVFSINVIDMVDIINQFNASITSYGYDGNYTWIKIDSGFDTPFTLKPEFGDYVSIDMSDDLSGLQRFRIVAAIREEKRTVKGVHDPEER